MEPANKPPVDGKRRRRRGADQTEIDFLPDADAIERGPLPRFVRLTLHVLALALFAFIVWASLSRVEKVVTARGRLVNPQQNIVVQPLETSIIQRIDVQAGQIVKKGQVLATLDPTFAQADEAQLRTRLRSLDTQTEGLRAELAGKRAPGATAGGKGDADDVLQEQLMAEQFGAKLHLLEARDRRLEVERDLVVQQNKAQELASSLAGAQAERAAFGNGWRQKMMEDLLAATRDRDGVNEQLAKADKRHQLVQLVAPADAVVLDTGKLSVGSVIREAETMFTLVPLGAEMEAEVQIDSLDIGYIKPGALAHLKVDAFSFQQHGTLDGKVVTISQDAFRREAGASAQGLDAYYLSRITFSGSHLKKMGAGAHLLPGMTLSAEIVVGKRSVMSYLLWPLTKAVDESIREP